MARVYAPSQVVAALAMASKLAATLSPQAPASKGLFGGKASQFYLEVCRCLPFIYQIHQVEEVVTLPELRRIIKDKFLLYKDVKDPRVIDMLIFKGREELETYLMRHKQRHHMITEYAEPYQQGKTVVKKLTGQSQFLDNFFSTSYPQTPQKL